MLFFIKVIQHKANSDEYLNVVKNVFEDLLLCDAEVRVGIIRMWAGVDDAIHI